MSTVLLFKNNARSRVPIATAVNSTTVTLTSGDGAKFPSPTAGQAFMVTMEDRRTQQLEIMLCTSRSGDILNVSRGQEGTSAQDFASGAVISNRMTAGTLDYFMTSVVNTAGYTKSEADAKFVDLVGDSMSGDLNIQHVNPTLNLSKTGAGERSSITGRLINTLRWEIVLGNQTAESGGNGGSDFNIVRYADNGAVIAGNPPMTINRATGAVSFGGVVSAVDPTLPSHLVTKQYADANYTGGTGTGVTDGDKGDIVVSNSGATWMLDTSVATAAGRTLLGAADVTAQRTTLQINNVDNTSDASKPLSTATTNALALKENTNNRGAANGYCPLDSGAKVPSTYLPAYVDEILEYPNLASFPATGQTGFIYLALDTNKIYRWSGSVYVEVSPDVGAVAAGSTGQIQFNSSNLFAASPALSFTSPILTVGQVGTSRGQLVLASTPSAQVTLQAPIGSFGNNTLTLPPTAGTNGQPLTTDGAGSLAFGTLGVVGGGTGVTTLTGVVFGSGTSAMQATQSSTVGQLLRVTGANTYAFGPIDFSNVNALSGFDTAVYGQNKLQIVAGTNISITANDGAKTLTITSTGGTGGIADVPADSKYYVRYNTGTPQWIEADTVFATDTALTQGLANKQAADNGLTSLASMTGGSALVEQSATVDVFVKRLMGVANATDVPTRADGDTRWAQLGASNTFAATTKQSMPASVAGGSGFQIPHGTAPSSPVNGDIWTTTGGLYARIANATQGPYGVGTVTGVTAGAPITIGGTAAAPVVNIPKATGSVDGYLAATDFAAFNSKQAGDTTLTALAGLTFDGAAGVIEITATDTFSIKHITISSSAPTGGNNGDIWFVV